MNCEQIHQMLIELVYDELDPAGKAAVQEHLIACPACREELAKLTQARAALRKFRAGEPEQTAIPAMLAQAGDETAEVRSLRQPLKSQTISFRRIASMFAAAAAAVLIAVALWMFMVEAPPEVMAKGPMEIKRQGVSLTIMSAPENVGPNFDQMQPAQMTDGQIAPRYGWQGLAIVRDQRLAVNLPKGNTKVTFTDVPTGIKPYSVRLRSLDDADGLTILEQNYQYDLAGSWAVLKKYIDKDITVAFKDAGPITGKLMSFDDRSLVILPAAPQAQLRVLPQGPRTVARENIRAIEFEKLPEGLLTRPTLVWELTNKLQQVKQQFEVAYMTTGLAWRADYVLKLHPAGARTTASAPTTAEAAIPAYPTIIDSADLIGYATVVNRSGVRYDNAQLKLMAGDVNLVRNEQAEQRLRANFAAAEYAKKQDKVGFEEKSFFEYHLYTLQNATTLADNETKQLSLVGGNELKLRRAYVYDSNVNATAARVVSEFKNTEENGLGRPLPKGVVRLYAPDPTGTDTYVAQTTIDHTPVKEKIRLPWGFAFDIVCSARQTGNKTTGDNRQATWQYTIRNHKNTDVTVTVIIHVPATTTRVECSDGKLAPHQRQVGWLEIEVPLKAGGEAKFDFSYDWNAKNGGGLKLPTIND